MYKIFKNLILILFSIAICLFTSIAIIGCSAFFPQKLSLNERTDQFSIDGADLDGKVTIYWNNYAVPFIEAEKDQDLPFALGAVHAHLRLGQMEFLKRIVSGRFSEMAGPFTTELDYTLRILAPDKVIKEQEAALSEETRDWITRFTEGINYYQKINKSTPPEFDLLGIEFEPWTVQDVLRISRLAGSDVTWFALLGLLNKRNDDPDFKQIWQSMIDQAKQNYPSYLPLSKNQEQLTSLISISGRNGSNAVVVAGQNTKSGAALIANDPHLGFSLPNFWVLAGVKSPSLNCVGMMIPGVPIFGLGRNQHIAWGGTNMRAAQSELVLLNTETATKLKTKNTNIKRRFWWSAKKQIRESEFGPVLSDSSYLPNKKGEDLAILWAGHSVSDEIGAFLKAAKSSTVEEFRLAFKTFGVSAQNMLVAHKNGEIGQIMAGFIPKRKQFYPADMVIPEDQVPKDWKDYYNSTTSPFIKKNRGIIASANNRPTDTPFPLSFYFSPDDRVKRIYQILNGKEVVSIEDLKNLQLDTFSKSALELRENLIELVKKISPESIEKYSFMLSELANWDGYYSIDSRGALIFEFFLGTITSRLYEDGADRLQSRWNYIKTSLLKDFLELSSEKQRTIIRQSLKETAKLSKIYENWGEIHRIRAGYILSGVLVIDRFFTIDLIPAGGSRETLMKSVHGFVKGKHTANYGAQSRHISDMSDPNENYFILFGGQDGWLGSENYADHIELWKKGEYIKIPLEIEQVKKSFKVISDVR